MSWLKRTTESKTCVDSNCAKFSSSAKKFAQKKPMALPFDPPDILHPERGIYMVDDTMTEETAQQQRELYPDIEYLGAGHHGLAVDLGNNIVGKYTDRINEISVAEYLRDLQRHGTDTHGFPRIYDTKEVQQDKEGRGVLWVILMEKVRLLTVPEKELLADMRTGQISAIEPKDKELAQKLNDDFAKMVENADRYIEAVDTHSSNIGYDSRGEMVLFDLSALFV